MHMAIGGSSHFRDGLFFENMIRKALDAYKEPLDTISTALRPGVCNLATSFAEEHEIVLCHHSKNYPKQLLYSATHVVIIWDGKDKWSKQLLAESKKKGLPTFEVNLSRVAENMVIKYNHDWNKEFTS